MMNTKKKKIVVIGGGTGSSVILSGLRRYPVDITAIVSVADSGGSTGRLRTEFGFLPVGDMRQCLAALGEENGNNYVRQLLLYRFSKGEGLKGHNLGNLVLTALTDITSSEAKAVEIAARIFRLRGNVLPISLDNIQLVATYEDDTVIVGEHKIDEPLHVGGKRITKLSTKPVATVYNAAKRAIIEADLIVLGPGDLYTSILPNLIVSGVQDAFSESKAKVAYIVNLMTRFSQTDKYSAKDHVNEIEKYLNSKLDVVLLNSSKIPENIRKVYEKEKGYPVKDDIDESNDYKVIKQDLLTPIMIKKPKGDVLQRSYLRHDSKKIAKILNSILK